MQSTVRLLVLNDKYANNQLKTMGQIYFSGVLLGNWYYLILCLHHSFQIHIMERDELDYLQTLTITARQIKVEHIFALTLSLFLCIPLFIGISAVRDAVGAQ